MREQVNFHEDPAAPDLRAWNLARASLLLERYRMNLEQASCFLQGEGAHGYFQEQAQPADLSSDSQTNPTDPVAR